MTPRHQRPTVLKKFLFGAPYYPEHWTEADREQYPERMAAAHVNVVRMAEFAWDRMEPAPGNLDFSLFDEMIEKLAAKDIETILCTPTAAPPRWLSKQHPDWMRIDRNGKPMLHGSRQHFCTNQPGFRKESARITRVMAEHFKNNPHVIGWQTDNEFHCHINECYCPACLTAFQSWLEHKYGDIGTLNQAWGTAFWSLTFDCFADILFPYPDRPTHANPSQQLDFYRFLSDGIGEFQHGQIVELRQASPHWWISHNGLFGHIDHWKFAEELDFYGYDVYPGFSAQPHPPTIDPVWAAVKHEDCRAASGNYVIFEQQGGAGGQRPYVHPTPRPGQMRLWAWQSIAHGADGILHFRWRTCRYGAEIYWNGILDHDNVPRRRFEEFTQEGEELARIGPKLLGTVSLVEVAILTEMDQDEAHLTMPLGLPSPWEQRQHLVRDLMRRHLPYGLINAKDAFDGIRLLIVPGFVLMDEALASKLKQFVADGGILVASARTATRTRDNQVFAQTAPAHLQQLFGLTVEENGAHDPLTFTLADGDFPASGYYEILQPLRTNGAEIVARWNPLEDNAPHAAPGQAAMTRHPVGKGFAYYIGTLFGAANTASLLDTVLEAAEVSPLAEAPNGVEITCRRNAERSLLIILNHEGTEQTIRALPEGTNLITGETTSSEWTLPGYEVAVIDVTPSFNRRKR